MEEGGGSSSSSESLWANGLSYVFYLKIVNGITSMVLLQGFGNHIRCVFFLLVRWNIHRLLFFMKYLLKSTALKCS